MEKKLKSRHKNEIDIFVELDKKKHIFRKDTFML